MPHYKLTYFNFPGLGEVIRFLLSYGGEKWEDVRLEWESEEWKKLKPSTPWGILPMLEIDGKILVAQHIAIGRYLAKQYGLAGDNDLETLEIDGVIEALSEFKAQAYENLYMGDPDVVKKNYEEASKTTIPFLFENRLNVRAAKNGYLANNKLSWADLYFVAYLSLFNAALRCQVTERYPNLKKVEENVLAMPNIQAWIEKRPKFEY